MENRCQCNTSPVRESLQATTLDAREPSCGQPIFTLRSNDWWGLMYYIRMDRAGSFHTYPSVGGPFQSLREAENAINCYLLEREDPNLLLGVVSEIEKRAIGRRYWPDGTRKTSSQLYPLDITHNCTHHLAQSLLDNYNEDHNLVEDLAYQLKQVVGYQPICEVDIFSWCYHINFTAQAKGVGDDQHVFFAELISKREGENEELLPSCLLMLTPTDNGTCHGCINNGSGDHMRHPRDTSAYTAGHVKDAFLPFGIPAAPPVEYAGPPPDHDFDIDAAEETRLHNLFTGPDAHLYMSPPEGSILITEEMKQEWLALCEP